MSDQEKQAKRSSKRAARSGAPDWVGTWGTVLEAAACEHCNWSYLLSPLETPPTCPHCFRGKLEHIEDISGLPYGQPPELIVPFASSMDTLYDGIRRFARSIPFAPPDLTAQNLGARLQRIMLPVWLVDVDVRATWQSEVGFDYDVVSFEDRFSDGSDSWSSQRITETRIRWEPRMGKLQRKYENITAPALEEHARIEAQLGEGDLSTAQAYSPPAIEGALVRLPTRTPEDAWPSAVPTLQARAAQDCLQAAAAKHQRDFRWSAEYVNHNWTQVLLPAYTTYYLDDEQAPQALIIHGRTHRISGSRRASMIRARTTSLVMASVAALLGFPGLLVSVLPLLLPGVQSVAGCGLALALLLGVLAAVPIAVAWQFNRRHSESA